MSENKTRPTNQSVIEFLQAVPDEKKRQDSFILLDVLREATGFKPVMWGDAIIGYGSYHYRYASGREGDAALAGFSPRKDSLVIYITSGFDLMADLLPALGKHKRSVSCLYVKSLKDIDLEVLKTMIRRSVAHMQATNEPGRIGQE